MDEEMSQQNKIPVDDEDDKLLSFENFDRSSPDLWPEKSPDKDPTSTSTVTDTGASSPISMLDVITDAGDSSGPAASTSTQQGQRLPAAYTTEADESDVPGVTEYEVNKNMHSKNAGTPRWLADLEKDDINLLQEFGSLTLSQLMEKVRGLQNLAYQLGLEEAREMTRGKFLNILAKPKPSK